MKGKSKMKWFKKITYRGNEEEPVTINIDFYQILSRNEPYIPNPDDILLDNDYKILEIIRNMNIKNN